MCATALPRCSYAHRIHFINFFFIPWLILIELLTMAPSAINDFASNGGNGQLQLGVPSGRPIRIAGCSGGRRETILVKVQC